VRAGHSVLFRRADALLAELGQARADRTYEQAFRRYLVPDLVILDDFGLRRLTAQQSNDLYELVVERHRTASFAITSNRGVDEWLGLFDDPILGNSALDRLANAAHQIVLEGPSTALACSQSLDWHTADSAPPGPRVGLHTILNGLAHGEPGRDGARVVLATAPNSLPSTASWAVSHEPNPAHHRA
jgi:hypothetical protein